MAVISSSPRRHVLKFSICALIILGVVLVLSGAFSYYYVFRDVPVTYVDEWEHFKYGSIGSEPGGSVFRPEGGILPPYWVFQALPEVCPDRLPGGYPSLGLLYEEGRTLPIGLSKRRRLGLDWLGVNCALCHVGSFVDPQSGKRHLVPGMPAGRVDVQQLLGFTVDCILDPRFGFENVLRKIRKVADEESAAGSAWHPAEVDYFRNLGYTGVTSAEEARNLGIRVSIATTTSRGRGWRPDLLDRILYRRALRELRSKVEMLKDQIGLLLFQVPASGPGRLDTFNPLKATELGSSLAQLNLDELIGAVDFPHLWNLADRDGRGLHWDGNLDSVDETIRSALLGVGVKPETLDRASLERVTRFLMSLKPPPYPFGVDPTRVAAGSELYGQHCASCHGSLVGTVTRIGDVTTDAHRLNSFTAKVATELPQRLEQKYRAPLFRFTHFHKTNGYLNVPLAGVWARAPYLHNGSVRSLRDLLEPGNKRPRFFYRGGDVFDVENVGFLPLPPMSSTSTSAAANCVAQNAHNGQPASNLRTVIAGQNVQLFLFDTRCPGNDNVGHVWGTELLPSQKLALLEFLKTL